MKVGFSIEGYGLVKVREKWFRIVEVVEKGWV